MKSLQGQLLVSSAGLYDSNFRHTVVLIGSHDEEGAVGVVLNRSSDTRVAAAIPPLASLAQDDAVIYQGGPVQTDQVVVVAELTDPELAGVPVFDSVGFLTGDVPAEVRSSVLRARVFVGYSGWGAGQLEAEIAEDAWIVEPARVDDVFTDAPDQLWKQILLRKGPQYRHVAMMPFDPRVN